MDADLTTNPRLPAGTTDLEGIAPAHRRPSRLRRLVAGVAVAAAATGATVAVGESRADAINPAQGTSAGVFAWLAYTQPTASIPNFWKWVYPTFSLPSVVQYGTSFQSAGCGWIDVNNSFYCPSIHTIYLSRPWNQTQLNGYGDYAPGGIAAHEFGHSLARYLGARSGDHRDEYFADCLAGVYTNYGYRTGRLVGTDYGEMYNWLYARAQSTSHGYGPYRADWYRYGYQTYSISSCRQVFNGVTAATRAAAKDETVRHEHVAEGTQRATKAQAVRPVPVSATRRPTEVAPAATRLRVPSTAAAPASLLGKRSP